MAILKMKKIRLCGIAEEQDQLIRELQLLGSVEIGSPEALTEAQQTQLFRTADGAGADALSQTSAALASALETLKHYETKKGGMFSARPEKTLGELFDDDAYRAAVQTAQEALDTQDARSRNQAEKSRLTALRESFVPWRTLDLPLETGGTQHARVLLGTVPAQTELDALRETVYGAAGEAQVERISADLQSQYLLVIVHKGAYDAAASALRESGFTQTCFDGVTGTAAENIRLTDEKLAACEQEDKRLTDKLTALAGDVPAIRLAADRCTQEISKAQAADRLAHSERTFCLDGWVPCEDVPKLEALLEKFCCAWELEDPSPEEYPDVPVKLKNNRLTWPLNMVTEMYSLPAYDGVDPNPLMAPFFILFYGIMMADMGYGLVMMIAALVALGKMKPKRGSKYFCELLFACGVSTFLLGIVTGGFFGNAVPTIVKMFGHDVKLGILTSPLLDPLTDTTQILIGAMVLGFIQLSTGMVVNMVMECRQGKVGDAIFNEGTWFVIFAGLALFVLKIGNIGGVPVVLCIGVLMLIYGSGREAKGFGKVTAVFGAVYNGLTGWFGDILSYSRLMALMLAGSVIAQVFNTLAAMPSSGGVTVVSMLIFIIIFLLGHLLNFGLNLLGCFVHDLRLQCLEFFGKFYVDGGKPFRPLEINTRYVDVENHNF